MMVGIASSIAGGATEPGAWDVVVEGEWGTVVVVDGAAVCAGCAGGTDETGWVGGCGAVGAGDVAWVVRAGTAGDVEAVSADAVCAGA
jgi:hypothetical protein